MNQSFWRDGIRLAALNRVLSLVYIGTFLGILALVTAISAWRMSATGDPRSGIPFPAPLLFLLYAAAFIVGCVRFGRGMAGKQQQVLRSALLGTTPVFGLSLVGYASVVWITVFGDFGANQMLNASVWVYGMISTLILTGGSELRGGDHVRRCAKSGVFLDLRIAVPELILKAYKIASGLPERRNKMQGAGVI